MTRAKLSSLAAIAMGLLVTVTVIGAQSTTGDTILEAGNIIAEAVKFFDDCGNKEVTYCLKERAVKYLDNTSGNIEIADGVTLKETNPNKDETQNMSNPSLPEESRARENVIDSLLMDRLTKFLSSHTLEFKLPKSSVAEMKRGVEEGRKKKKKKMMLPLLLLLKLKAAALLPLLLGGIALIAFKALVIGKVALVITALVALKKIIESKETSQTYEVVAHPHHSHSHVTSFDDHHHGHYRRALIEDPQNVPYSAYVSNQQLFGNE